MKQSNEAEDVFAFTDGDYLNSWAPKRYIKPTSDNYRFLQHAPSGSVIQTKEVLTVDLDEDDVNETSAVSLDSPHKDDPKGSEGLNATLGKVLEQHSCFTEGSVSPEMSSHCMENRVSTPLEVTAVNGDVIPLLQKSSVLNGSVDFRDLYGMDKIQESSPSTPSFELEENNVCILAPIVGQAQNQFTGDMDMDDRDTVVIQTDYIRYGDKYFPASMILFLRDSIKMKAFALEEESAATSCEWKVDSILRIDSQCCDSANVAKVSIRLLTDDATHAENADGASGVEVVEFLVHGPEWLQHKEHIMSLNHSYKALLSIWMNGTSGDGDAVPLEDSVCCSGPYIPHFEEPFEEVVYPKGDIDAVSVRKSDFDLLQPEVFVNDTIIDFYITYLKNEMPREERDRFHFFSSFFFRKLADLDKNPSSVSDGKAAFQRVRRWTRKVNIFEKDYIFIPVNYNLHWSLIVLCHLGEVAYFSDENIDEASKVPCILHMDSIRGSHAGLKDLIQSYLLEEWKERQKKTSEDICSKILSLRFLSLELPQQENCFDCGLFLLHYAELFIAEATPNFSPFQINKFDNFLKPDWFMPAEASLKRVHIQRLISDLLARRSNECASLSGNNTSHFPAFPGSNENDNGIEIISEKGSPEKLWNGNSLYTEPLQGMELGQLSMSMGRASYSGDHSNLGMTELLEQYQSLDREASLVQLGFTSSTSRDVEGAEHHAHSALVQTGLQPDDRVAAGESHSGYASRDCGQVFQWNGNLSDLGDHEDNLSQDSHYSSDDSADEMIIFDSNGENQIVGSSQNGNVDQSEEIADTSAEGYASASSDVMETPAEDSQEMANKFGKSDQEDPLISSQEEVVETSQEELDKVEDDGVVGGVDEKVLVEDVKPESEVLALEDGLIVDDTDSDDEQPAKRTTPRRGEEINVEDILAGSDDKFRIDDPLSVSDDEQPAKRVRLMPSQDEKTQLV